MPPPSRHTPPPLRAHTHPAHASRHTPSAPPLALPLLTLPRRLSRHQLGAPTSPQRHSFPERLSHPTGPLRALADLCPDQVQVHTPCTRRAHAVHTPLPAGHSQQATPVLLRLHLHPPPSTLPPPLPPPYPWTAPPVWRESVTGRCRCGRGLGERRRRYLVTRARQERQALVLLQCPAAAARLLTAARLGCGMVARRGTLRAWTQASAAFSVLRP